MAATLQPTTAPQAFSVATAQTSGTGSVTVDAGSNRVLVCLVQGEGNGAGGITVSTGTPPTYGGSALTKLDNQVAATWGFSEIWYRIAPTVGTANLVVTLTGADTFVFGAVVAQGVNQTTPLRTAVKQTGTGTSASVTVASVGTNDLVFDSLEIDATGHAAAPGAGQTERWDQVSQAGRNDGVCSTQLGSSGGVMSYTWTGSDIFNYIASAFIAAATGQTIAAGQALENDTATAVAKAKLKAVAQASSTETAQAITRRKTLLVGQALESASAQPVARTKAKALGQALESDTAQAIAAGEAFPVSQARESDTAGAVSRAKARSVAQAQESDTSQAIARSKALGVSQVVEGDSAGASTHVKLKAVGQAQESDQALSVGTGTNVTVAVSQALESDAATALGKAKTRTAGQAQQTHTAQAVARVKYQAVGAANEADSGLALTVVKGQIVGLATQTTTPFAFTHTKLKAIVQAFEVDSAQVISPPVTEVGWLEEGLSATCIEGQTTSSINEATGGVLVSYE